MCYQRKSRNDGVSPVVGVMLMLVVTIIIAAVVSAFAGGMSKTTDKAPTASLEVKIANDGTWGGSYIDVGVKGVSDAIPTKDLKIITTWKAANGTSGGATVFGPGPNTKYGTTGLYNSPLGFGPGVNQTMFTGNYVTDQWYGNYSLVAGTRMHNSAYGYNSAYGGYGVTASTRYQYTDGTGWTSATDTDAMMAILGPNWSALRPGDIVRVKILHVPTGKVLYDGKVTVEG